MGDYGNIFPSSGTMIVLAILALVGAGTVVWGLYWLFSHVSISF